MESGKWKMGCLAVGACHSDGYRIWQQEWGVAQFGANSGDIGWD
jgi:hypothetical protein